MKLHKSKTGMFLIVMYYTAFTAAAIFLMVFLILKINILIGITAAVVLGIAGGVLGGELEYIDHKNTLHKKHADKKCLLLHYETHI